MNRFSTTEAALLDRLRALKATPLKSLNLIDINLSMRDDGFSPDEISAVLVALEQDRILARAPGDRLMILKELPD